MKKVSTVAVVGLGHQAMEDLLPMLLAQSQVSVTAICDVKRELIKKAMKLLPNQEKVKTFTNYNNLFQAHENEEISLDGVVVSVPHFLYFDISKRALEAGVPVFKEKPLALNKSQAEKLAKESDQHDLGVYTVTKREFYPSYKKGLEILNSKRIGAPYMYSARHFIPHGNLYEGWRSSLEKAGGGVFLDMGYHLLDILVRYFGDVNKVVMTSSNKAKPSYNYEVEDAAILQLNHKNEVHGVFQVGALSGPKEELIEIRATNGIMRVTENGVSILDTYGNKLETLKLQSQGMKANKAAFKQFLSGDKKVLEQNLEHNLQLMNIVEMAYQMKG